MAENKKTMLKSSKPETLDEEYQRLEDEMDDVPAEGFVFFEAFVVRKDMTERGGFALVIFF